LTPDELADSLEFIDGLLEENGINIEAEAERERQRKLEIYDDFLHVETESRTLHIPQPTLGFLMLYQERRRYFEDDEHGLGRLLIALRRMKEPGYIRALRAGADIPPEESQDALKDAYPENKVDYYLAIESAAKWGDSESEKKTRKLLAQRTGLDFEQMERLHSLLSSPDTPRIISSTECQLPISETS
jgi:hypothetical protein